MSVDLPTDSLRAANATHAHFESVTASGPGQIRADAFRLPLAARASIAADATALHRVWSLERITGWRAVGAALSCAGLGAYLVGVLSATALSSDAANVLLVAVSLLCVAVATTWLCWTHRGGVRETLIVGTGEQARAVHHRLVRDRRRRLLGFVDSLDDGPIHMVPRRLFLGGLPDLDSILMRTVVDEVIVALPIKSKYDEIQAVIRSCELAGVECTYSAQLFRHRRAKPRLEWRHTSPAVRMLMVEDDPRLIVKRVLDVVGALVLALVCLPLMIGVGVAVKATSRGPILFVQERYGYRKRRFRMLKFRTMVENAEALLPEVEPLNEATGHAFKIRNDPRLTPLGSFLRRWSLDELPQLLNVLRGDMSLVGPRPMSVRDVERFSDPRLMRRFSVRPGLTCLWQISGRSDLTFDDWMTLDLYYIDHWSSTLDMRILAMTLPAVLTRSGAA